MSRRAKRPSSEEAEALRAEFHYSRVVFCISVTTATALYSVFTTNLFAYELASIAVLLTIVSLTFLGNRLMNEREPYHQMIGSVMHFSSILMLYAVTAMFTIIGVLTTAPLWAALGLIATFVAAKHIRIIFDDFLVIPEDEYFFEFDEVEEEDGWNHDEWESRYEEGFGSEWSDLGGGEE